MGTRQELGLQRGKVVWLVDRQISSMGGVTSVGIEDDATARQIKEKSVLPVDRIEATRLKVVDPGTDENPLTATVIASSLPHHTPGIQVAIYAENPNYVGEVADPTLQQLRHRGVRLEVAWPKGIPTVAITVKGCVQPPAYRRQGR